MNYTEIRRLSLKVFLGFLGLTAVIAILSLVAGDWSELELKILATSFTISTASICSMSCAAFIEKKKLPLLGIPGILLSVSAAILLIVGLWWDISEIDIDGYWQTAFTFIVLAFASAHAFQLVLPELDERQKWI